MTAPSASGDAGHPRCFLALLPDAAGRAALQRCCAPLAEARGARPLDAATLHLTLRFFGDATTAQCDYIVHMLPTLARPLPVFAARRLAIWPNRARPRMVVLEFDAAEPLQALAQACEALACKAGFDPEPRAFRPHLTLARLRPGCALDFPATPLPTLAFASLALVSSQPGAGGARHRVLASVGLTAADGG